MTARFRRSGDETPRGIARELVETVRNNVTIDWTLRENVRANLRRLVCRILRKYGSPALQAVEGHTDGSGAGGGTVSGDWTTACLGPMSKSQAVSTSSERTSE